MDTFNPDFIHVVSTCLYVLLGTALLLFGVAARSIRLRRIRRQKIPTQQQLDMQYWSLMAAVTIILAILLFQKR